MPPVPLSSSCRVRPLFHLRQRGLDLRQPERHVHGAVEVHGSGQSRVSLLPPVELRIQHAETTMAVGLERAHADRLGQGEGLAVVALGRLDLRGAAVRGDVAEEPQGIRLIALPLITAASGLVPFPGPVGPAASPLLCGQPAHSPHPARRGREQLGPICHWDAAVPALAPAVAGPRSPARTGCKLHPIPLGIGERYRGSSQLRGAPAPVRTHVWPGTAPPGVRRNGQPR
jgi:hypothetical protein